MIIKNYDRFCERHTGIRCMCAHMRAVCFSYLLETHTNIFMEKVITSGIYFKIFQPRDKKMPEGGGLDKTRVAFTSGCGGTWPMVLSYSSTRASICLKCGKERREIQIHGSLLFRLGGPCSLHLGLHTPHCLCPPLGPHVGAPTSLALPRLYPSLSQSMALSPQCCTLLPCLCFPTVLAQGLSEPLTGLPVLVTLLAKPTFNIGGAQLAKVFQSYALY